MILPAAWSLPDALRARLGQNTYGRQRAIFEEGHLLLVLHKPPGPDDTTREGMLLWRNPSGEWQYNRGGPGPGPLKRLLQSYNELEQKLTQDYEQAKDTKTLFDTLAALTPLTRSARNVYQALQAAREALKADAFILEMRDQAYAIERNLELLLEDTRNAIQYRTTRKAEEQALLAEQALHASHRLNLLAAMFFPLTAVASLFGMNLAHGLNPQLAVIFWLVAAVCIGLGFAMLAWVVRPTQRAEKSPASEPS